MSVADMQSHNQIRKGHGSLPTDGQIANCPQVTGSFGLLALASHSFGERATHIAAEVCSSGQTRRPASIALQERSENK
jgi:hypothetical protein